MAKKPLDINSFLKLSSEEQAKAIERETAKLLSRLPSLKNKLQLYNDTSSEMYNLTPEEIELQGMTYARAVRKGEITTPTGKQAYQRFVKNLTKYTYTDLGQLARESASARMDSWLEHIKSASTEEDIKYAQELLDSMTEDEKLGFTRSKYFMDSSYMYMVTEEEGKEFSIQTLKLELYLEEVRGKSTKHIYRNDVKKSEEPLRRYKKKRQKKG